MKKKRITGISWHEVLDRSSLMENLWAEVILSHPAVKNSPAFGDADRIANLMADFYQKVGKIRSGFND